MFGWLKTRSQSQIPGSGTGKEASGESRSQAHRRFRLEPLEPRVLLSGDSIVVAVAYQALLDGEAKAAAAGVTAVVEQLDANTNTDSSAADTGNNGSSAASNSSSDPSVAWPESWQPAAANSAKKSPDSVAVGATETQVPSPGNPLLASPQAARSEQVDAIAAVRQTSDSESDSSLVEQRDDNLVVTSPTETQLPRGPPGDDQSTSVLIAEESIHNNDLKPSDASAPDAGGFFAVQEAPFSEPAGDALPRAPPAPVSSVASEPQYLRSNATHAAPAHG